MNRFSSLALLILAASGATASCGATPSDCGPDESCDEAALKAGSFKLTPTRATVSGAVFALPFVAATTLKDSTKKGHNLAVTCTGGAKATPASGSVSSAKPLSISIQAPAPQEVGTTNLTCTFSSTSGSNSNAVFKLKAVATGGPVTPWIKTVWLVVLENRNWSQLKGSASAPYLNGTLLPLGAHAERYFNPPNLHPSEPNYLWLEAGTNFGVKDDALPSANHQATAQHLATLLEGHGLSWRAYQEGISGTDCPVANEGLYAPKHNPFVFFDDVADTDRCVKNVRPYGELAGDLQNDRVASYNFVTPDLCNDMHNSSGCATSDVVKNGDRWLAQAIPPILASAAYQHGGAIFITWDESVSGEHPIGMIVLSPKAKAGYASPVHFTHSSMLRTLQEIFGVTPLLGDAAQATNLADLFQVFP